MAKLSTQLKRCWLYKQWLRAQVWDWTVFDCSPTSVMPNLCKTAQLPSISKWVNTLYIILPFRISSSGEWFWSLPGVQCHEPPSILLQALYLSDLIPWIYLSLPLNNHKEFDLGHDWMVLWLSLLFTIWIWILQLGVHDLSHSQLPVLFLLTVYSFSIFSCKEYNQSVFGIDHLVMSMCRIISCVVGRGCLLWPVYSLGKTLLASALLHSVFQGQLCLLLQVFLDFLLLHSSLL